MSNCTVTTISGVLTIPKRLRVFASLTSSPQHRSLWKNLDFNWIYHEHRTQSKSRQNEWQLRSRSTTRLRIASEATLPKDEQFQMNREALLKPFITFIQDTATTLDHVVLRSDEGIRRSSRPPVPPSSLIVVVCSCGRTYAKGPEERASRMTVLVSFQSLAGTR